MPDRSKSIVLDSNIMIEVLHGDVKSTKPLITAIKHGYEIIIPEHVLSEVNKKIRDGKYKTISWLFNQNPMKLSFTRDSRSVIENAKKLAYSYSFCHFPDNRILAQCKENDSILMTMDGKLLQSADYAGIMACKPKDFGGFVSAS